MKHTTLSRRPRMTAILLACAVSMLGCNREPAQRERFSAQEKEMLVERITQQVFLKLKPLIDAAYRRGLWEGALVGAVFGLIAGAGIGANARRAGRRAGPEVPNAIPDSAPLQEEPAPVIIEGFRQKRTLPPVS